MYTSSLEQTLRRKIDFKTKPLGALGLLEKLAFRIAMIQKTETPVLSDPTIVVFAGDHGIASEGVSAYPPEVTFQMVENFIAGGAAINVFCRQNGLGLRVVDAGVRYDFSENAPIIHAKAAPGTANFLREPAMTDVQLAFCLEQGALVVHNLRRDASNVVGFGEMGIGNTSSASVLMSLLTGLPLDACVGRGTGLSNEKFARKKEILAEAIRVNGVQTDPREALRTYGGFEIAQMVGAIRAARSAGMTILIDGFISTAAALVAFRMQPNVLDNIIFSHRSEEQGHALLLDYLGAEPVLQLQLRLGEGTGCALAYPVLKNAVAFLNQMSSFEEAGVSGKTEEQRIEE
ncbi:nicotinate-nucleotide--dimethylbenzimidazole phosphoribosyltransferase [Siphonobacter aquaeclarae]|jgi:nicotinate-nucleotide--dimethylbenzimidazole phosphoribosyltransferase|uniref:Nicotinate-nucleotide--dimethylbenzimidazole phosphoribosyltransferase n=1 Tax=Siphonobacter aquaeclarae TaxID=563176 RepID=A0A1G9WF07_9BACT|nr:nicotinate-nucleotide--dimethylbenzimidazole phosphoribosyltransferase [Siphonobacter aquaeclarae]SDM83070.1 nicotinate-nucleotide-dimethylbenzimidazole phosphoribosyltransferase [Siphonobacter aquaeclarae]